jgi:hypothetical protein
LLDRIAMWRRYALGVGAAVVFVLGFPVTVAANGDPPSDVLLSQDVYLPFMPATSDGVARALLELARRTRAAHWPIKIAVIATAMDLGDVANLLTRPQDYANVLAREISNPRLLVVTPVGFGGQKLGDSVDDALAALQPVQPGEDRLERQAMTAVARLAAADGHRVALPVIDTSEQGRRPYRQNVTLHKRRPAPSRPPAKPKANGGGTSPLVYAALIAIVVMLLATGMLRDRVRRRREPAAADEPRA